MPEIKHNFTGGKMNKDLDERLVPNGQYRDAMNIQVSTSEGSDVGTIQNILGNHEGCVDRSGNPTNIIPVGSKTVGSISDEKNDAFYWLVSGPKFNRGLIGNIIDRGEMPLLPLVAKDMIMGYDYKDGCYPIFVDKWGLVISNSDNSTDPTQGSVTNDIDDNILIIDHPNSFQDINIGMQVTAFDDSGNQSNTCIVTGINALNTIQTNFTPGYDPGTSTASGPVPNVILGAFETSPNNYNPTQTVYIRSNNYAVQQIEIGDVINIHDDQAGVYVTLSNTLVTSKEYVKIWDPTNTVFLYYYEIICSQAFDTNWFDPTASTKWGSYAIKGGNSGVALEYTWGGTTIIHIITLSYQHYSGGFVWSYPNPTATLNGDIFLPPGSPWIDNLVSGMVVDVNNYFPSGGCIDVIDIANNMFTVDDCAGAQVIPTPYSPGNEWISISTGSLATLNTITLNNDIILSNSDYLYLYFEADRVLNFGHYKPITGINIVDDMLFWTDNYFEPKKINISRSIQGTDDTGDIHTKLVNDSLQINLQNIVVPIKEEHITVIKKSPKTALILEFNTGRDADKTYTGFTTTAVDPINTANINLSSIITSSYTTDIYDFSALSIGDTVRFIIDTDDNYIGQAAGETFKLEWKNGDSIVLKEFSSTGDEPPLPITDYRIKSVITDWQWNSFEADYDSQNIVPANDWPASAAGTAHIEMEVTSLQGTPPQPPGSPDNDILKYAVDLFEEEEILFEFKFPRFSYRYRYEDGEYSTFAPWSEIAFVPGSFDYHPKKGYNLGMTNRLKTLKVKDFITEDIPKDVVEIDLLYKEDISPNIYTIDTIKPKDEAIIEVQTGVFFNNWNLNEYTIERETINAVLPSNQLLRPWDNVPKKALAQEVSGNRLIYANYEQNYNLTNAGENFKPNFKSEITSFLSSEGITSKKSIKSLREYQLGVVFSDKYGRETPVLSNNTGLFKLNKDDSFSNNRLRASFDNQPPQEVKYFKFFIKETSGEYYNLAMDRWYDAEDGNLWLAFPSSDRNKVDIDTFLILKRGDDTVRTTGEGKYNILAIENEAPDFIKTKKLSLGTRLHDVTLTNVDISNTVTYPKRLFGHVNGELYNAPRRNSINFSINYISGFANSSLARLDEIDKGVLYVRFIYDSGNNNDKSGKYRVSELTSDRNTDDSTGINAPTKYFVALEDPFDEDIDFIFDNASSPSKIKDGVKIQFYKHLVENSAKFDGRFFAKIFNDGNIKQTISDLTVLNDYLVDSSKMVYLLGDDDTILDTHANASITNAGNGTTLSTGEQKHLHARIAYFGALTEDYINYAPSATAIALSEHHANFDEGVWFIDESYTKYSGYSNSLWYTKCDPMSGWTTNPGHGQGIAYAGGGDNSRINLSFGGIEAPGAFANPADGFPAGGVLWSDSGGGNISSGGSGKFKFTSDSGDCAPTWYLPEVEEFFNIGKEDGNSNYNDAETMRFVEHINSSYSFIWEKDPTQTIYTIKDGFDNFQRSRFDNNSSGVSSTGPIGHSDMRFLSSPANFQKHWRFWVEPAMTAWNPTENFGGYITGGLELGGVVAAQEATTSIGAANLITTTAVNPLIKVGMTVSGTGIQSGTIVTGIDAAGNNLSISETTTTTVGATLDFGYTIRIISSDTSDLQNAWVKVDQRTAICANNNAKFTLHKGMVISTFNDTTPITPDTNHPDNTTARNSNLLIKKVESVSDGYIITITGYTDELEADDFGTIAGGVVAFAVGEKIVFRQACMNSVSNFTETNTDLSMANSSHGGIGAVGYRMDMITPQEVYENEGILPEDPFIWETEPKESIDLDIYYEISGNNPIRLDASTINTVLPIGSGIVVQGSSFEANIIDNISPDGKIIFLDQSFLLASGLVEVGDILTVTRPDDTIISVEITEIIADVAFGFGSNTLRLSYNLFNSWYTLNWHNCYSFGNGVESNRIRDSFNLPFIKNGVKASTTLSEQYKEERRKSGLIYSGIYNSTSGVNNLNQFIQAEKITKDINPMYGSIQKLHTRDTNLVTLCEDKCLKILANKDAVFNADGNTQLTATENVLGQTIPFVGEFGISKNPESFASESYRAYFTDKQRGAVIRLSKDGITPISEHGMKDWFRDHLKLVTGRADHSIVGSYDDRQGEYNVTLKGHHHAKGGLFTKTLSFNERVKGWVSFKSFTPENGISCTNDYFTFLNGVLYKHHVDTYMDPVTGHPTQNPRNTFYGSPEDSTFNVILNDMPGSVKSFNTLNYEGSQSKVDKWDSATSVDGVTSLDDAMAYNLDDVAGWYVQGIKTDQQLGSLNEFIEKEGKWFNYIKGVDVDTGIGFVPITNPNIPGSSTFDVESFAIQGLGRLSSNPAPASVYGCTDSTMFNYDSGANVDDGSCVPFIHGCMDILASNHDSTANLDPFNVCLYDGCTDSTATNYDSNANNDDGSCNVQVLGCTDSSMFNYDSNANTDDGSCISFVYGCTDTTAFNYNNGANTDNGTCVYLTPGCTDSAACNYDSNANFDDGDCEFTSCEGCTDSTANNYNSNYTITDNSLCEYDGCTSSTACNYDSNADDDDGTCVECNTPTNINVYPGYTTVIYQWENDSDNSDTDNFKIQIREQGTSTWTNLTNGSFSQGSGNTYSFMQASAPNFDGITWEYRIRHNNCSWDDASGTTQTCHSNWSSNYTWTEFTSGCTDLTACNPTAGATVDDSSCEFVTCAGCMDATANNYPDCLDSNGNAINCTIQCGDGTDNTTYPHSDCCTYTVTGCIDPLACNYNSNANQDDGSCLTDYGCTDSAACGYDANATCDDGSCISPDGCTDPSFCSYDSSALCDDSSCTGTPGCTDPAFAEYYTGVLFLPISPTPDCDDGSYCITACVYGCTYPAYCNYDSNATCFDNTCAPASATSLGGWGCTDNAACNFDSTATCDDVNMPPLYTSTCNVDYGCTDALMFNYDSTATCECCQVCDGSDNNYCCEPIVYGCMDSTAFNYIPSANTTPLITADQCCYIAGCTNPNGCEYDPNACYDDGSCTFATGTPMWDWDANCDCNECGDCGNPCNTPSYPSQLQCETAADSGCGGAIVAPTPSDGSEYLAS